ncbi:MAG: BatA domain-containing protein, partial [Planctomycetes bacterium]|nr:BatA domain-containing protein [Planctomycetota bacterium]
MLHFLNPTLLFFASAAALPILLHLFRRQKIRDVAFAAVRFVQRTKRKTRSKISIKQLLVLLLRISILAFLALALARPMLTPAGTGLPNAKAPNAAPIYAIVLDDSLSMNYRHAGTSWFTRARNRALEVVSSLPFESQIAVASSSIPGIQLTREKAEAHDLIMNIRATERPASLPRALQRTVSAMKDNGASRNVIYLFTDMTAGSWGDVGVSPDQSMLELGADTALHIIDCGNEDPTNRAITSVEHIGEPVLQGAVLTLRTKIVAIGKPSTELVQFEFDGRIADRREIDLVEDRTEELTFRASITSPGNHWGRVRLLNPDALPHDNTRGFALDASPSVSVLCIDDTYTISNPQSGRSFFFRTALSPWLSSRGIFRVDIAAPRKLQQKDLASYDLLAIMSRNGPSPNGWRRISDFVAGGGALFVSLGKNIETKNYSGPAARETLPAIPYGTADLTEATGYPSSPRIVSPNHPLIDSLEAAGADITRSQFSSCSEIQPSESAHVMLGFSGDHPALVIGGPGERVAVFSGSLTGRSSDLARRPEFV